MSESQSSEVKLLNHLTKLQGAVLSYRICQESEAAESAQEVERLTEELWNLLVPEDHIDWGDMPDCGAIVEMAQNNAAPLEEGRRLSSELLTMYRNWEEYAEASGSQRELERMRADIREYIRLKRAIARHQQEYFELGAELEDDLYNELDKADTRLSSHLKEGKS